MLDSAEVVSNCDVRAADPHEGAGYENPHTTSGVHLTRLARFGLSSFLVHEAGYLPDGLRWHFPGVLSPFWRLYYNHDPGSHVVFARRAMPLRPDAVMVIPEGVLFDCVGEPGTSHLWLHFSPLHHLGPALDRPLETQLAPPLRAAVDEVVAAHRAPDDDPLRLQRLYHTASALLHATLARLPVRLHHDYPERLQDVIGLIESAPQSDLGNPALARRCGLAPDGFIRWFKQHTGVTPAAFVARSRVRQAAQRLVLGDDSVDEIAAACGFADRFHFTRVFRKQMGCGPAEFRRRHVRV